MKIELTPDEVELFRKSLDDTTFKWLIGFEKRLGKLEKCATATRNIINKGYCGDLTELKESE